MKKSYTFVEGVIHFCSLPTVRKIILPVLIIVICALLVFFKVKESGYANSLSGEGITIQKELVVKALLQNHAKILQETEKSIKNAIVLRSKAGDEIYKELTSVEDELGKILLDLTGTEILTKYNDLINLLDRKAKLQKKIYFETQNNITRDISEVKNSEELKIINENLSSSGKALNSDLSLFSAAAIQSMEKKRSQLSFWNVFVYISGGIFFFLIWIYSHVKTKQSSESEKEARESIAVKENFLANMSHEIRTPLNAVLGFTNILRNTDLNDEQKEYVEIIQTSGDNLLSIVNDILDLSKIEAGMLRIEEAPFRISDIVSTVEATLRPMAEEKNLKLIINVDSEVPEIVSGDAVRLTQILMNLASNAIKFTEDGGVYLRVMPVKQADEKVTLEFLVRDTGIGIPEEKQKTIFDRFEQAEASTTRRFGGTGLGLSIVKNLIELQKGTLSWFSQPGVGSSFTVEIPYNVTNEKVLKTDTKILNINPTTMKAETKILIAEDNSMNQRLIKHLMKIWGYNFDLVFNGRQALEALKMQHYDLVLMDIQMPEMDGYTAAAQIRSILQSKIPIIAMTAHALTGEREKCLKAGMDDYISKPINEAVLFEMIQKYSGNNKKINENNESTNISSKGAQVIDLTVINKYSGGDQEFRKELVREFIDAVPPAINSLETAISQGNYNKIKDIAHDMKTTIHVMGLTVLIGHLLQQIEIYACSNSGLMAINQLFGEIKSVCLLAVQEAARIAA